MDLLFPFRSFWPSSQPSPLSGGNQASLCPIFDEVSLEFCKDSKELEDEIPCKVVVAGLCLNAIMNRLERDSPLAEVLGQVHELLETEHQAIQSPHDEGIPFP